MNYEATWSDFSGSEWSKTQEQRSRKTTNNQTINYQALVLKTTIDSQGCTKKLVDDINVCVKTGHNLSFECSYSLENQELDSSYTVSGSDFADAATGTGTLTYTLAIVNGDLKIGETATATITPKTTGLVHASINECHVAHDNDGVSETVDQTVSIIDAGLQPICPLSAAIETGKGTGQLKFSWSSFKWSTTKKSGADVKENQSLKCKIALSVAAQGSTGNWKDEGCIDCYGLDLQPPLSVPFNGDLDACKKKCEEDNRCYNITFYTKPNGDKVCATKTGCSDKRKWSNGFYGFSATQS